MRRAIFVFFFGLLLQCLSGEAAPQKIVVIRHADKLDQKSHGPALSAIGTVRSVVFSFYFLDTFGKPDLLIAEKPSEKWPSIRELQTLGPLITQLKERFPDFHASFEHSYTHIENEELAKHLLNSSEAKLVVICWPHSQIPKLVEALGVSTPQPKWLEDVYDDVYVLNYDAEGKFINYQLLQNQYPVEESINWKMIAQLGNPIIPLPSRVN